MTRGQDSLMIDQFDVPSSEGEAAVGRRQDALDLPVILPSAAELEAHEAYLAALDKAAKKDCVWRQFDPSK
jgi:DNA polymerase-3 subunit epsilon